MAALVATTVALPPGTDVPVVSPDPVPEASFGVAWGSGAAPIAGTRAAGVDRLADAVRGTGTVAGLVGVVGALAVLLVAGSREGRSFAVRAALGAGPRRLLGVAARRWTLPLLLRGLGLGGAAGILLGTGLRWAWPHVRTAAAPSPWIPVVMAAVLAFLVAAAVGLPVLRGFRRLPAYLAAGSRATPSHREGALRRLVVVLQLTAAVGLLAGGAAFARAGLVTAGPDGEEVRLAASDDPEDTLLLPVAVPAELDADERGARWGRALRGVGAHAAIRAESLATPGSWRGLGTRDLVVAECGACVRGGLAVPLSAEAASHHAVSPGFFDAAGLRVLAGRPFRAGDGPGAPAVAVVSRSFALRNFEDGDPLGRRIRIGREGRWLDVVGVVEDAGGVTLGRTGRRSPAVYLALAQHPPELAVLSLRSAAAPRDATALVTPALTRAGVGVRDPAGSWRAQRRRESAPFRWAGAAVALLGLLGMAGAVGSVHATAAAETAARRREMAVRSALGATPRALLRWVLVRWSGQVARAAVLALPLVVAAGGIARRAGAERAHLSPVLYGGVVVLVAGAVLAAVVPAARRAGRVEPAASLTG